MYLSNLVDELNDCRLSINLISREELREKLNRGDKFKLVNALGDWAFEAKRIPGSISISNMQTLKKAMHEKMLDPDDEIIIHCSNPLCPASIIGYQLVSNGYKNVRRYAGGIQDWEEAGYPLEGNLVA